MSLEVINVEEFDLILLFTNNKILISLKNMLDLSFYYQF